MEFRTPIPPEEITKCTAIEMTDDDCHNYCIHEDDEELFIQVLDYSIENEKDTFQTFIDLFSGHMVGGSFNSYRKELKTI